ncbi:MAG: GIY-YIG nuclease family protein [Ktedonobacteraceae bacterium]
MPEHDERVKTGFSLRNDLLKAVRLLAIDEDVDVNALLEEGMQLLLKSRAITLPDIANERPQLTRRRDKSKDVLPITIYQLRDPRTNQICYVGYTEDYARRSRDYAVGLPHSRALDRWLTELRALGLQPLMEALESFEGTIEEALQRETYWINTFTRQGIRLLNAQKHHSDIV